MKKKFIKISGMAHALLAEESKVRKLRDRIREAKSIGEIASDCIIQILKRKD